MGLSGITEGVRLFREYDYGFIMRKVFVNVIVF